jgi:Flp pilus assembly pilin Flp
MIGFIRQSLRFAHLRKGASGLTYSLAVGLIAVVAIAAVSGVGGTITSLFGGTGQTMQDAAFGLPVSDPHGGDDDGDSGNGDGDGDSGPSNEAPVFSGGAVSVPRLAIGLAMTPFDISGFSDGDGDSLDFTALGTWPAGLSLTKLDDATVRISGTPTVAGDYTGLSVQVSDGQEDTATGSFSVSVNTAPVFAGGAVTVPKLALNAAMTAVDVPGFSAIDSDSLTFTPQGTWPAGISIAKIDDTTARIEGTPTQSGSFPALAIQASDGLNTAASGSFTITVNAPPTYTGGAITVPALTQLSAMSNVDVSGFADADGDSITFTPQGSWPPGVTLSKVNDTTARISGTPTQVGSFSDLSIRANDGMATADSSSFTITVGAAPCSADANKIQTYGSLTNASTSKITTSITVDTSDMNCSWAFQIAGGGGGRGFTNGSNNFGGNGGLNSFTFVPGTTGVFDIVVGGGGATGSAAGGGGSSQITFTPTGGSTAYLSIAGGGGGGGGCNNGNNATGGKGGGLGAGGDGHNCSAGSSQLGGANGIGGGGATAGGGTAGSLGFGGQGGSGHGGASPRCAGTGTGTGANGSSQAGGGGGGYGGGGSGSGNSGAGAGGGGGFVFTISGLTGAAGTQGGANNGGTAVSNIGKQGRVRVVSVGGVQPGCSVIGGRCADDTFNAGLAPDTGTTMYVVPCDMGMTWNSGSGTCSGSRTTSTWGPNSTDTMADCAGAPWNTATCTSGAANTTLLAGLTGTYTPADYCDALNAFGHTDWYLPSTGELTVIWNSVVDPTLAGPLASTFLTTGSGLYWSSSESASTTAVYSLFSDGTRTTQGKTNNRAYTRCVRKD